MTASALLVEPAYRYAPRYEQTLGPEVADLAALAGFEPDPEQRLGLDLIFALDARGRSAAFEVAVICGRQNLKTGLFKQAALGWLFVTDQSLVVWSAHEFRTSQEAFRDMVELIEGCSFLSRRVRNVYRGNGDESIELVSGQRLIFKARTKAGGRGLSGDKVVLDEAFALAPDHMGALLPTLSARPDPQVVYGSSAGLVHSEVLRGVRDRGRSGASPRLAYLEWCAPPGQCDREDCEHHVGTPGCALDRVDLWRMGNPLLGRERVNGTGLTVEYVSSERQALPPAEFARERMGWWDDPPQDAGRLIDPALWAATVDGAPGHLAPLAFGVTVAADRSRSWVGVAAARGDGRVQVELVAEGRRTDWVPAWVADRVRRWDPCAVVLDGTAKTLAPALADRDVEATETTSTHRAAAAVALYDLLHSDRLRHPDEPSLATAAASAGKRRAGDGWVWDGPAVGPLQAVTLALHGLIANGRPVRPPAAARVVTDLSASYTGDLATAGF